MYTPVLKSKHNFREALLQSYGNKCAYCSNRLPLRYMHVDHIIPKNPEGLNPETIRYIESLKSEGFVEDSIENYLPACSSCNMRKSNHEYTVTGLVHLHEEALRHVNDIIDRMNKIDDDSEEEPINQYWEELSYYPQKNIVNALLGSRLTQYDVEACPELPQVNKIIDRLLLTDFVVIEGKAGSGKSISCYQAGYYFKKNGWHIYKLINADDEEIKIPRVFDNSIFIIDDAQNYSQRYQDSLLDSARNNAKVILSKTVSDDTPFDSIIISNEDSIKILAKAVRENRDTYSELVHRIDKNVGDYFGGISIERRLSETTKAKTPWEFNYVLTGGWNRVRDQYKELREDNQSGLIACLIAVLQVLQRDNHVDLETLIDYSKRSFGVICDASLIDYLVSKRIVFSKEDIRIIHIQSAYVIIAIYLNKVDERDKTRLASFVEQYLLENHMSPLGLVWLINGLRSYTYLSLEELFLTRDLLNYYFNDLNSFKNTEERRDISWLLSKMFNSNLPINSQEIISENMELMIDWIQNADNTNAYVYSNLINSIINSRNNLLLSQIVDIDWQHFTEKIEKNMSMDLLAWGHLFNRLLFSIKTLEKDIPHEHIKRIVAHVSKMGPGNNLYVFYNFFTNFFYYEPELVYSVLDKNIGLLVESINKNTSLFFEVMDFDFLTYFCGLNVFGKFEPTIEQRAISEKIIGLLPYKKISKYISNSYPREWLNMKYQLGFIELYDSSKLTLIGSDIDIDNISEKAKDSWGSLYEIDELLDILYSFGPRIAKAFLHNNKNRIVVASPIMCIIDPLLIIEHFRLGKDVLIVGLESRFRENYYALKSLNEKDKRITEEIIESNLDRIASNLNNGTALNHDDNYCLKFLESINVIYPDKFKKLLCLIDKESIINKWDRCGVLKSSDKTIKRRKKKYFDLLQIYL